MTAPVSSDLAWLDDLERAHAAATEGPWFAWNRGVGWHIAVENPEGVDHLPGRPELLPEGLRTDLARAEDAALIVAAVNAVPTLIAAVRAAFDYADQLDQEAEGRGIRLDRCIPPGDRLRSALAAHLAPTTPPAQEEAP